MTPKPPILGVPATYAFFYYLFSVLQKGGNFFILDGLRITPETDIRLLAIKYTIFLMATALIFGEGILKGKIGGIITASFGLLWWNILNLGYYEGEIFIFDLFSTDIFPFMISDGALVYKISLTICMVPGIYAFTLLEELNPIDKILDRRTRQRNRIEENRETEDESERSGLHAGLGLHEEVNLNEPSQIENETEVKPSEKEESESTIPLKSRTQILLERMEEMEEDS